MALTLISIYLINFWWRRRNKQRQVVTIARMRILFPRGCGRQESVGDGSIQREEEKEEKQEAKRDVETTRYYKGSSKLLKRHFSQVLPYRSYNHNDSESREVPRRESLENFQKSKKRWDAAFPATCRVRIVCAKRAYRVLSISTLPRFCVQFAAI